MIRLKSILLESKLAFQFNDRGPEIKDIQQKLMSMGYSVGHKEDDGWFGRLTKRGVQHFQKENDLPVTGEMDQTTVDLIKSGKAKPAPAASAITTNLSTAEPELANTTSAPIVNSKPLKVTSDYGWRKIGGLPQHHGGVDFRAKSGTPIQILMPGTVLYAGSQRNPTGWGNMIEIKHDDGAITRYAHVKRIDVQAGQLINAGMQIGLTGGYKDDPGAGNSKDPHLHWEYVAPAAPRRSDGESVASNYFTLI